MAEQHQRVETEKREEEEDKKIKLEIKKIVNDDELMKNLSTGKAKKILQFLQPPKKSSSSRSLARKGSDVAPTEICFCKKKIFVTRMVIHKRLHRRIQIKNLEDKISAIKRKKGIAAASQASTGDLEPIRKRGKDEDYESSILMKRKKGEED
uniref:Uncharacterized protein n=1 Tax=Meloidogyne hapla TaxID=6305 RepID=A0A1I8BTI8_MELHA